MKKQTILPNEVQALLDQFKDIISDGTPSTLPPQRVVSRQLRFVLGDSLPNKDSYKMTLE